MSLSISLGCSKCLSEQGGTLEVTSQALQKSKKGDLRTPKQTGRNSALNMTSEVKCHTRLKISLQDSPNRPKNMPFGVVSQKLWPFKVDYVPVATGTLEG